MKVTCSNCSRPILENLSGAGPRRHKYKGFPPDFMEELWQADLMAAINTGSEPLVSSASPHTGPYPRWCPTHMARWRLGLLPIFITGSCTWCSDLSRGFLGSSNTTRESTGSPLGVWLPPTTVSRMTPLYREQDSNLEASPLEETPPRIGTPSSATLSEATWTQFPQMYIYGITLVSRESQRTMYNRLLWSELVQYSGVQLERGKVIELGKRPVWKLTLRTHLQSGGMDTEVKNMLSLMNLEELSTSRIYCDGSTSILSRWKQKEVRSPFSPNGSGSPPTYTQQVGTPNSIPLR